MAKAKTPLKKPAPRRGFSPQKARELFKRLSKHRPNPKTELVYQNPYTLLVAVALSAQATDVSVNKATKALFALAATPEEMLKLGEAGLGRHIRTIGLWRNKARNVIALSRILLDKFEGKTPRTRADLESLPGVGPKTASVVLNEAYGEATIAVDTHVFRVSNRTGLAPAPTPERVEARLLAVTPEKYKRGAHHWLILHGRYVCLARKPACSQCVIRDLCEYDQKTGLTNAGRRESSVRAAG